jgi:F-type H+-transporting ATPase subunit b
MLEAVLLAAGDSPGLTDISVPTMVWAWVSFLVTLFLLSKIAWPMLAKKMEEREIRIREGLEKAAEAERRAQELMDRQEELLQETRDEAKKLLAKSRETAENIRQETVAAAEKEISDQRERAKKEIDLERSRALDELRKAAVDLTLDAAGRVLEREIKGEDHRRLASEVIGEMDQLQ